MIKLIFILAFLTLLSSCSTGRYQHANDSTPSRLPTQFELQDAVARAEPYSRGGNKHYQVRGIDYKVLNSAEGFEQTGIASWYGKKFHGHLTSNGEIYNMYGMSAAHKNLPLPTYLKVTNLANNKSVIVRANDRGPFHENRIIDLSYSAAYKLDMLNSGTAMVKITAITEFEEQPTTVNTDNTTNYKNKHSGEQTTETTSMYALEQEKQYIQVFATSRQDLAKRTAKKLTKLYAQTVKYPEKDGIYRIQIGPIHNATIRNTLLHELRQGDYPNAYLRSL